MSRRDQIRMSETEVREFLRQKKTLVIVSNGLDGFPHPMPMWFGLDADGAIRMATYRSSQKVKNLERDPRATLLAEAETEYEKLKGVVLYGHAELIHDLELAIDTLIDAAGGGSMPEGARTNPEIRKLMIPRAQKRVVIRVKPQRVVSWDQGKLGGLY